MSGSFSYIQCYNLANKIYCCIRSVIIKKGFTLIEILFSLVFIGIILLFIFRFNSSIFNRYKDYQEVTQIKAIENVAIKYVNDNYLSLVKQSTINPKYNLYQHVYLTPFDYAQNNLDQMLTRNGQMGCLDVVGTSLGNDYGKFQQIRLDVTLYIGDYGSKYKRLENKQAGYIFSKLGGTTGVIKESAMGDFIIEGNLFSGRTLTLSDANDISNSCGFSGGLKQNNFAIKLSEDKRLLSQSKSPLADAGEDTYVEKNKIKPQKSDLYFDSTIRESTATAPELHSYRAIDFGSDVNQNRILLHNNESIGYSNSTDNTVTLSNAGIRVGKVQLKSESIVVGSPCSSEDMGRTYRELLEDTKINPIDSQSTLSGGDLVCTYNVVFCPNNYCYLPKKGITLSYNFSNRRSSFTCPNIMRLTPSTTGFIDMSAPCQQLTGYNVIKGVHEQLSDCFNAYGANYCKTFSTVCTYQSQYNPANIIDQLVPATQMVKCTNDFNYIIINNYKYTGG